MEVFISCGFYRLIGYQVTITLINLLKLKNDLKNYLKEKELKIQALLHSEIHLIVFTFKYYFK